MGPVTELKRCWRTFLPADTLPVYDSDRLNTAALYATANSDMSLWLQSKAIEGRVDEYPHSVWLLLRFTRFHCRCRKGFVAAVFPVQSHHYAAAILEIF